MFEYRDGNQPTTATQAAVVAVARESYVKLRAWLAYQWRDVAAAEDALGTALAKALAMWPQQGVPDSPEAWLLSVAKRELQQAARHQRLHDSPEVMAVLQTGDVHTEQPAVPDERLKLLFVCAHPAIDAAIRPALMLQVVLALDAQKIAQAMLTSPSAMAQRLVRAKQKIQIAKLKFEAPDADELPERVNAVLQAIYAAYGLGWDSSSAGQEPNEGQGSDLRQEALYLSGMVCELLPNDAEALGLRALMHYCEARTAARYDARGNFIALPEQNTARWSRPAIEFAENLLRQAACLGHPGPFQLEAAIQSAHCQRLFAGQTPWAAIANLYAELLLIAPSTGAKVAQAVACAHAGELAKAAALLASFDEANIASYQPYWVASAHVAQQQGNTKLFQAHLTRAIGLTGSAALRVYLQGRLEVGLA